MSAQGFIMLARALSTTVVLFSTTLAVAADAALPAVETMTCEQMTTEMIVAGQKMNSQLDPEFAREAQAMHDQMTGAASAGSMMGGVGSAVACSIPGIGMFCMAAQQAAAMGQAGAGAEHMERMQAQMERLQKAMEGLDVARLEMMSQRFEEQKCQVPQDGAATP